MSGRRPGRPRDPAYESEASLAFSGWVETVGLSEACRRLHCSRQTVWNWCVASYRPSSTFREEIEQAAGIPIGDWERYT